MAFDVRLYLTVAPRTEPWFGQRSVVFWESLTVSLLVSTHRAMARQRWWTKNCAPCALRTPSPGKKYLIWMEYAHNSFLPRTDTILGSLRLSTSSLTERRDMRHQPSTGTVTESSYNIQTSQRCEHWYNKWHRPAPCRGYCYPPQASR